MYKKKKNNILKYKFIIYMKKAIIRRANPADLDRVWEIFWEIIEQKEYYPYDHTTPHDYLEEAWINLNNLIYVAEVDGEIAGAYIVRPNQAGYGGHVANAAYMVDSRFRNHGLGRRLGEHSLLVAKEAGYRAMQYNFVVSTNESAVHLWQSLGFEIVGRAPEAFHHWQKGYVDAYIMYRKL